MQCKGDGTHAAPALPARCCCLPTALPPATRLPLQYGLYERRQAGSKAKRALAAKRAADPSATALSLEEDVLPKLEVRWCAASSRAGHSSCPPPLKPPLLCNHVPRLASQPTCTPPPRHRSQLLEALCPGLGWQVFRSYPEQFGSPEAAEAWRIAGAMLFTEGGLQPDEVRCMMHAIRGAARHAQPVEAAPRGRPPGAALTPGSAARAAAHPAPLPALLPQVAALMVRHIAIFRQAVEAPDNLRRLLAWLRRDLGLTPAEVLKLCTRCPLVLQVGGIVLP